MSRKKYQQPDNSFGARLRLYREIKGLGSKDIAKLIGVSQGSISAYENNLGEPKKNAFENLIRNTDINIKWLLTGYGEPQQTESDQVEAHVKEGLSSYGNDEVGELLEKARNVLKSGNAMASDALSKNIIYFHHAIEQEMRLSLVEQRLGGLEKIVKHAAVEKIRETDPPNNKDELIKMRVISSIMDGNGAPE